VADEGKEPTARGVQMSVQVLCLCYSRNEWKWRPNDAVWKSVPLHVDLLGRAVAAVDHDLEVAVIAAAAAAAAAVVAGVDGHVGHAMVTVRLNGEGRGNILPPKLGQELLS